MPPTEAFTATSEDCMFGGDDGVLCPLIPSRDFVRVGNGFGLKVTEEEFDERSIIFFSRRFTLTDRGEVTSSALVLRALGNLSVGNKNTFVSKRGRAHLLYLKCKSVLLTDSHTPVLGEFAHAYVTVYEEAHSGERGKYALPRNHGEVIDALGSDLPYKLRDPSALLFDWQPDQGECLVEEVEDTELSEFDLVAFSAWVGCVLHRTTSGYRDVKGQVIRDRISYLRRPPAFLSEDVDPGLDVDLEELG
jgi:hypothetical protein